MSLKCITLPFHLWVEVDPSHTNISPSNGACIYHASPSRLWGGKGKAHAIKCKQASGLFLGRWKMPPNLEQFLFRFNETSDVGDKPEPSHRGRIPPLSWSSFFKVQKGWCRGLVSYTSEWTLASRIQSLLLNAYPLFLDSGWNVKWQSLVVTACCGLQPGTRSIAYFANQLLPYLHAHFLIADEATRSLDVQVLI